MSEEMTTPTDRQKIDYIAVEVMGWKLSDRNCDNVSMMMNAWITHDGGVVGFDDFNPLTDANHAEMVIAKCREVLTWSQAAKVRMQLADRFESSRFHEQWMMPLRNTIEAIYAVMNADRKGEG